MLSLKNDADSVSLFDLPFYDEADFVVLMVSYFDASQIGDQMAVAGVLFRKSKVRPFERKWRAMLKRYGIDSFHMTDCNAGRGEFEKLSDEDCDTCAREAINLLTSFAERGMSSRVSVKDFEDIIGANGFMPNAFTLCVWSVLYDLWHWRETRDQDAKVIYVFEAGDTHQSDAHNLLNSISEDPERARRFCYYSHAFHPKARSLPTQAADILAWHVAKQADRNKRGIQRQRGDFKAIVSNLAVSNDHHDTERLGVLKKIVARHISLPESQELARLAFFRNKYNVSQTDPKVVGMLRNALIREAG